MAAHGDGERAYDLLARQVAGVQHAATRVAALAPEVVLDRVTRQMRIEARAERDQLTDAVRPLVHHHLDDVLVAEAGAGADRVGGVRLEGVLGAPDGRHAALRVRRVALVGAVLGDDRHPPRVGDLKRERQARDAAPDDEVVPGRVRGDHGRGAYVSAGSASIYVAISGDSGRSMR